MKRVHALCQCKIQFRDAARAVRAEHDIHLSPTDVQIRMVVHRLCLACHRDDEINASQIAGKPIAAGEGLVFHSPAIQRVQTKSDIFR